MVYYKPLFTWGVNVKLNFLCLVGLVIPYLKVISILFRKMVMVSNLLQIKLKSEFVNQIYLYFMVFTLHFYIETGKTF